MICLDPFRKPICKVVLSSSSEGERNKTGVGEGRGCCRRRLVFIHVVGIVRDRKREVRTSRGREPRKENRLTKLQIAVAIRK